MATQNIYDYDTQALRSAAARLKRSAQALSEGTKSRIARIQSEIGDQLVGEAGTALTTCMREMNTDIDSLKGQINAVAGVLLRYAAELERTEEALRKKMGG